MPDGEQMNPFLLHVESVNDPIVAHASSKTVRSFDSVAARSFTATSRLPVYVARPCRSIQSMTWKRFEAQSDFIDFRFDACPESSWQLEEDSIETLIVNLSRRAHEPLGSRTRAAFPAAMSRSDR
jgi:hypothetical protein